MDTQLRRTLKSTFSNTACQMLESGFSPNTAPQVRCTPSAVQNMKKMLSKRTTQFRMHKAHTVVLVVGCGYYNLLCRFLGDMQGLTMASVQSM